MTEENGSKPNRASVTLEGDVLEALDGSFTEEYEYLMGARPRSRADTIRLMKKLGLERLAEVRAERKADSISKE